MPFAAALSIASVAPVGVASLFSRGSRRSHATFGKARGDYAEDPGDYLKKTLGWERMGMKPGWGLNREASLRTNI